MRSKTLSCAATAALALVLLAPALPASAQVTDVEELTFPPLPERQIPEPERFELDNGMVVLLLEDHELPLIDAVALTRTGERLDPEDHAGLARIASDVLRTGGTETMTGDELDDFLESHGASIEVGVSTTQGRASMSVLKQDFARVLEVFGEVLRRPVFAEEKIAVAMSQAEGVVARQNDNPQGILFREMNELVYAEGSPYVRQPTYASLANIDREDLLAWHERFYRPDAMVLGLVGDFDTEEALAQVRRVFGDWRAPDGDSASELPAPPPALFADEAGLYFVEKSDITQSNIIMGHAGIRRDAPDYAAVQVMNQVLSGSFASRLFNKIRTEMGLAYAVSGSVGAAYDHPGVTRLFMTTQTGNTGRAIEALLAEARDIRQDRPPTAEEVERAKESILNSFIFNTDTRREILEQQVTFEYYGYPLDWLDRYRKAVEKVSVEDVRQAARKHIRPERFATLVVGPSEGLDRPLSELGLGEVEAIDITIPEPEAERVEATAEGTAAAEALLGRAVEALGGEEIDAVVALETRGQSVQRTPQGEMEIGMKSLVAFPDRAVREMTMPFGTLTVVVTPEAAFVNSPQGVMDLPGSQRAVLSRGIRSTPLALLKAFRRGDLEVTAAGGDEVGGTQVELVQVDWDGEVSTLAVDPATGRILQVRYVDKGPSGAPGEVIHTYSDFREVEGVLFPFATEATFEGEPSAAATTTEIVVNPDFDESRFERPVEPVEEAEEEADADGA